MLSILFFLIMKNVKFSIIYLFPKIFCIIIQHSNHVSQIFQKYISNISEKFQIFRFFFHSFSKNFVVLWK